MHYVYILKSLKDGRLYIGYSHDLKKRLEFHNNGSTKSTKNRLPLKLIYYEAYLSETDARKREMFFKTGWGRSYIHKNLKNTLIVDKI